MPAKATGGRFGDPWLVSNGAGPPLVAGSGARQLRCMWFIVPVAFLVLAVLIGSAFAGGIYTLVLVPVVVIVAGGVGVTLMLRRSRARPSRKLGTTGWAPTPGAAPDDGTTPGGGTGGDTPAESAAHEPSLPEREGS